MQDDYIESRLDPQIKYYDKRSTRCHNEHNYLSIFGIILTAAIPPLQLLHKFDKKYPACKGSVLP